MSPIPWIGVVVSVMVIVAGLIANYAVTVYRQGAAEKRIADLADASEKRIAALAAELRDAVRDLAAKLDASAGHGFSLDAQAKSIEFLEREVRRARDWLHRLRTAVSNVILLLHLIRKGVPVPPSAIDKIAADLTAADDEPDENGGK